MRLSVPAAVPAALLALLAGCGSQATTADRATDPTTPEPTSSPTVGSYPDYPHDDYSYTLRVSCFCPDADAPLRITVDDGTVTEGVWSTGTRAHRRGAQAPDYLRVTLDDIIAAANDTRADKVRVEWPAGQGYPTSVWVDRDKMMADEEIGYTVSDVVPAG